MFTEQKKSWWRTPSSKSALKMALSSDFPSQVPLFPPRLTLHLIIITSQVYTFISSFVAVVVQSQVMSDSLWPHGLQHTRLPCPSPSPRVTLNSCPLSQWCHPPISSSAAPFSSCSQSFLASEAFPMSWLFASSRQIIGASTSASVLKMNIQGLLTLGLTGLIPLLSQGLSRVFSCTTVQNHQLFSTQLSL